MILILSTNYIFVRLLDNKVFYARISFTKKMSSQPKFYKYLIVILLKYVHKFLSLPSTSVGRDSSVDIATRYGLDGPGIESRWGRDIPQLSRPALGPTQPPVQWVPGLSWGEGG